MKLRLFSNHERGIFVSIDGPSGVGKSTIVWHLARMLVTNGEDVHVTAEPSDGPIDQISRSSSKLIPKSFRND